MNTFEFALDLSKQTAMEPLRLRQGDKNGTEVRATIYDHGTLVTGSYTSRICLSLPDGEHYYRKAGTFSAGVATVTIDEQEAASVVGRSYGYIQLLSGSTVIASTASFPVLVLPDATADATVPETYDTAIQEAIDDLNDAVADLPETVEEILDQHHEWTTTVQDNSVTDAKLIQSGGILSRNARLMYRLANLLTHRTDEGTLAAISDAAQTPMAGLSVYGQSTQDGTPTPEAPVPIVSVAGGLIDVPPIATTMSAVYNEMSVSNGGIATSFEMVAGETYTLIADVTSTVEPFNIAVGAGGGTYSVDVAQLRAYSGRCVLTFTPTETQLSSGAVLALRAPRYSVSTSATITVSNVQLVRGSIGAPVPYENVGLLAQGRNLFCGANTSVSNNGVTRSYDAATGLLTMSGTPTANNTDINVYLTTPVYVPEGGTLTLSFDSMAGIPAPLYFNVFARGADGSFPEFHNIANGSVTYTGLGGKTINLFLFRVGTNVGALNLSTHVMVEYGSTPTAYQPYTETVTPIDLDGHELRSLPDGTRDELTVDAEGHVTLVQRVQAKSIAASSWTLASNNRYSAYLNPTAVGGDANVVSTAYTPNNATSGPANAIRIGGSGNTAILAPESTLVDSELLYALATPVTHDLGTVPLVPLVGPDLTAQMVPSAPFVLTYERDATIVLDRLTAMWANVAPVEGDTASANYSVGSYLMHGGQLCKVTTAIATGETIAIGTNVVATTVMAEVIALTQ